MNYYEKNLGDYAKEAGHLSMAEHGAFNLLLDYYFANEKPVPKDMAYKIARARAPEEREIVDAVLAEFFELQADDCYHRQYCDDLLAEFMADEPVRKVKKSNEAGRQQKYREDRARMFAALNAVGQFPDWNIKQAELRKLFAEHCDVTQSSPLRNASRNASRNALQDEPETREVTLGDEPATRDTTATSTQYPIPNTQYLFFRARVRTTKTFHVKICRRRQTRAQNKHRARATETALRKEREGL